MIGLLITGCDAAAPSSEQSVTQPPQSTSPEQSVVQAPQVGKLAPDFTLDYLDGGTVSLSDFRGSPVLINFWATWCPPCKLEMPFLEQVFDEWSDRGLVLLTIDIGENQATVEDFMRTENLSLPVLMDKNEAVSRRYNIRYFPTIFLVDKDGIIQSVRIGVFSGVSEIEQSLSEIMP
ncbi:MAG: redoxin domain-containing protein [Chloroflexota bacterium]